jgi:small subunit ribosomal protein S13
MRISGVTIPDNKRLEIGLTTLFGIGRSSAKSILNNAGIDHGKQAKDLTETEESELRKLIEARVIEGDLRREVSSNIKRFKDIKSFRGSRHIKRLPARGQRTKTNSRTTRPYAGRKTMGSGKRKVEKK